MCYVVDKSVTITEYISSPQKWRGLFCCVQFIHLKMKKTKQIRVKSLIELENMLTKAAVRISNDPELKNKFREKLKDSMSEIIARAKSIAPVHEGNRLV